MFLIPEKILKTKFDLLFRVMYALMLFDVFAAFESNSDILKHILLAKRNFAYLYCKKINRYNFHKKIFTQNFEIILLIKS